MSKCHVRELTKVYEAIFKDASYAFPTLGIEFERDLARLQTLVKHRGLQVFLVDLVAVGKHLDRCLSDGQYKLSGLPLTKRYSGRVVIPKFLRGLYLLVFDEGGRLKDSVDTEAVFFLRQILFAAKKYKISCTEDKVKDAVIDFIRVDEELPEPEGYWNSPSSNRSRKHPYKGFVSSVLLRDRAEALGCPQRTTDVLRVLMVLDSVSNIIVSTLGPYRPSEWRFRHGPGAISETTGPTNKYHWYSWTDYLESEFPIADYGYHNYCSWASAVGTGLDDTNKNVVSEETPKSRLVDVPKTYSGPRLIACEPASHQWCQQNIWHYFRARTEESWIGNFIPFGDQTFNQDLCMRGSRENSLATVDLSAASDRVSCHVVGQFFRGNPRLLSSLRASRTQIVSQDLVENLQTLTTLRKFSTMGSACTFPVESLVFLGVVLACALKKRGLTATLKNISSLIGEVAVFGDDIVIPNDCRVLLQDALEVLYFKVNDHKSHWTGRFRESCGVDSFDGVNVTPVYWKQPCNGKPEATVSAVECRNNFYRKFLLHTAGYLTSTLPKGIPWVASSSGVFGLQTRCRSECAEYPTRYNPYLQRVEFRVLSPIAKQSRTPVQDDSGYFQYFTEDPSPWDPWASGVPQRPRLRMKSRWVDSSLIIAQ